MITQKLTEKNTNYSTGKQGKMHSSRIPCWGTYTGPSPEKNVAEKDGDCINIFCD